MPTIAEDIEREAALRQMLAETQARLRKETSKVNADTQLWDPNAHRKEFADAQMRCDSVAATFGQQAPKPVSGEDPVDYRIRLARPYQRYCKDPNLQKLDLSLLAAHPAPLDNMIDQIYADAMAFASSPASVAPLQLREVKVKDNAGREMSTFIGDPDVWLSHFKGPQFKVRRFMTPENSALEALRRIAGHAE